MLLQCVHGGPFRQKKTYKPKKEFACTMCSYNVCTAGLSGRKKPIGQRKNLLVQCALTMCARRAFQAEKTYKPKKEFACTMCSYNVCTAGLSGRKKTYKPKKEFACTMCSYNVCTAGLSGRKKPISQRKNLLVQCALTMCARRAFQAEKNL